MRGIFLIAAALALSSTAFAKGGRGGGSHSSYSSGYSKSYSSSGSSHTVSGYTRKDGTYVAPHHSTNRDNTKNNNWTTQGNVNPYTGKAGTKPRD